MHWRMRVAVALHHAHPELRHARGAPFPRSASVPGCRKPQPPPALCCVWIALSGSTIRPQAAVPQLTGRRTPDASRRSGVLARSGASSRPALPSLGHATPRLTDSRGRRQLTGCRPFRWTVRLQRSRSNRKTRSAVASASAVPEPAPGESRPEHDRSRVDVHPLAQQGVTASPPSRRGEPRRKRDIAPAVARQAGARALSKEPQNESWPCGRNARHGLSSSKGRHPDAAQQAWRRSA